MTVTHKYSPPALLKHLSSESTTCRISILSFINKKPVIFPHLSTSNDRQPNHVIKINQLKSKIEMSLYCLLTVINKLRKSVVTIKITFNVKMIDDFIPKRMV